MTTKRHGQKLLIGLCGQAGSGKDTIADHLVEKYGFVKIGLADLVKRMVKMAFHFSNEQLWGPSELRNRPDSRYMRREIDYVPGHSPEIEMRGLTPRYALQRLGTEWGRDCYENVWIEAALAVAHSLLAKPSYFRYSPQEGLTWTEYEGDGPETVLNGVVISDVRFANEISAIQKVGGKIIKVLRPAAPTSLHTEAAQHKSETELQGIPPEAFNYIFQNDADLNALYKATDRMVAALAAMPK